MMCVNCLVCSEPVPVEWVHDTSPRICQKCKDAIMVVRRNIELCERREPVMDSTVTIEEKLT